MSDCIKDFSRDIFRAQFTTGDRFYRHIAHNNNNNKPNDITNVCAFVAIVILFCRWQEKKKNQRRTNERIQSVGRSVRKTMNFAIFGSMTLNNNVHFI